MCKSYMISRLQIYCVQNIRVSKNNTSLTLIIFLIRSFKERGARYALLMLSEEQKRIGVISASLGNHAQGLSYHANRLGIPVTVVMPTAAPIMKIQKCRNYGANVIVKV